MNLFCYRPGAIGDTILTLPALAALRARFPGCTLTYAGNPTCLPLLPVDRALSADDRRLLPLFEEPPRMFEPFDLAVVFARQPVLPGAIQRDPLEAVERGVHMVDWLVEAIDPSFTDRRPRIPIFTRRQTGCLAVHPGAGSPTKRWPLERFAQLSAELDLPVGLITGPAEEGMEEDLRRIFPHARRWDDLALAELVPLLAGARLFVGNDSGITHLAAALDIPTVAIYVSTDPRTWGIRGSEVQVLSGEVPVAEVARACTDLLEGHRSFQT